MLHLELPHVNVLSKVDLVPQYGQLGGCCLFTWLYLPWLYLLWLYLLWLFLL
jgi:hypothetical protein